MASGTTRAMRRPRTVDVPAALRSRALTLAVAPLAVLVAALLAPADRVFPVLVAPAALSGLVLPVVGYRVYHYLLERVGERADSTSRTRAFRTATLAAMGITGCAALFGIVAFWLSGSPPALLGTAMHVIVVGAVWPAPQRLERFLEDGDGGS